MHACKLCGHWQFAPAAFSGFPTDAMERLETSPRNCQVERGFAREPESDLVMACNLLTDDVPSRSFAMSIR